MSPVDLTAAVDPELSRVVILREPTFIAPFLAALANSSDPSVPSETIVVAAPTRGLADEVRSLAAGVRLIECPIDLGTAVGVEPGRRSSQGSDHSVAARRHDRGSRLGTAHEIIWR